MKPMDLVVEVSVLLNLIWVTSQLPLSVKLIQDLSTSEISTKCLKSNKSLESRKNVRNRSSTSSRKPDSSIRKRETKVKRSKTLKLKMITWSIFSLTSHPNSTM